MKNITAAMTFGLLSLVGSSAFAQSAAAVKGEYLVKYRLADISSSQVAQKIQGKANLKAAFKAMNIYHISLKAGGDEKQTLNDLRNDPDVEYVEPNYILQKVGSSDSAPGTMVQGFSRSEVESMAASNSSDVSAFTSNTYSQNNAPTQTVQAWSVATAYNGSNKVIVAVVDTGIDYNHKVFKAYNLSGGVNIGGTGALWVNTVEANGVSGVDDDSNGYVDDVNGWNFVAGTSSPYDDEGHGTHVSGIIVGAGLNILASPLDRSKIIVMPLKFLDSTGAGTTSNAIKAIYYAVDNGAKVINNSWGGSSASTALLDAMTYAYNHRVLMVTAAGNNGTNNNTSPMYPANYDVPSNFSVAATTDSDGLAYFSNYGTTTVHIGSPGMNIYSTIPSNYYGYMSGTSMAAPYVAGVAALAFSEAPNLTGYQVKNLLVAQGDNDSYLSNKLQTPVRVNAYKSVTGAQGMTLAAAYQPSYAANYSVLDLSSTSSSAQSTKSGGCGMISTQMLHQMGSGPGGMGVLFSVMMLPLLLWAVFRARVQAQEPTAASRRKYERFKMNSEVRVKVGERELVGSINTISMGGLSFNVDEALEKGGVVSMRIASPDGKESVEVQGQIVWSEQNQAYGVQFSNVHEGVQGMIKHWTQNLIKT